MIEILIACMFLGLPIIGMVCWLVSVFEHDGPLLGIIATTIIIFFVGGAGYMFYDQYKSRNELIMVDDSNEKQMLP